MAGEVPLKPRGDMCLPAQLPHQLPLHRVVSGIGSPCWHAFRGGERRRFHRASHTLPSTGMIAGQVWEDLSPFPIGFVPLSLALLLWENSANAAPHVWMDENGREHQTGGHGQKSRLASPVEQTRSQRTETSLSPLLGKQF